MKRTIGFRFAFAAITGILLALPSSATRSGNSGNAAFTPVPAYDPYPPDIVPADLDSEIARVQRETRSIEDEALGEWRQLPHPTTTGNPPTLQGGGYESVEVLGKLLNFDLNMSPLRDESCSFCHMPYAGFSGPIPSVNLTIIAYPATYHYRAAKRTAQRYTYSPDFPVLEYNSEQAAFFGGDFWDARATGYALQSADSEQAQHPPVDPDEMGFPDTACIAYRLSQAVYRPLFQEVWGDSFDIKWPGDTEKTCGTPNSVGNGAAVSLASATPVQLSPVDRAKANNIFDHWGQSISKYERSPRISAFSSKFDAFVAGKYTMTPDEKAGYQLFNGKGNCNSCHLDGVSTTLKPNQSDTGTNSQTRPLFTCFGYANEGLPLNANIALFYETKPDSLEFTPNPYGFGYRDLGLGNFLRSGFGSAPNPNATWVKYAPNTDGQFQTSTARDVAMTPPKCPTTEAPGPYFQKEFFHNGYIKSLKQLVHFYNTRDVYPYKVTTGHCPAGTTEKVDCWPMPEVPNNIDMTTGNLGLSDQEENQIVVFLETLTDGYTTPYPDSATFTGECMKGGSAATQGNSSIVPAPTPLPPCASAICGVEPLPGPKPIPYGALRPHHDGQQFAAGLTTPRPVRAAAKAAAGDPGSSNPATAQAGNPYQPTPILPPAKKAEHVEILQGPALEFARDDFAIIRWAANNPGGSDEQFAVIHYGTDPGLLSRTAKSPIRLNRSHPETVFRVRLDGLKPLTTYYYRVTSMDGGGMSEGARSPVEQFTTPGRDQRIVDFAQPN
jgi:cytochrome c peroxidase